MYYEGIVLEIKEEYCLVMDHMGAIYRIEKKDGIKAGDKIYFLDENILSENIATSNDCNGKNTMLTMLEKNRRLIAFAAAILIFIGAIGMVRYNNIAYATLSMDAEQSVQLELNRNGEVVGINSFGRKLSKEEMKRYEGMKMEEFWQLFASENKDTQNPFMIGYVVIRGGSKTESRVAKDINRYIVGKNIMVLKGVHDDIDKADNKNMSIGEYIFSTYEDNDELEEFLEDSSKASVKNYLEKHKHQISKKDAKKIIKLKNKIDRAEDDEDEENSSKSSKISKPSKVSKPSKPVKSSEHQDSNNNEEEYEDED